MLLGGVKVVVSVPIPSLVRHCQANLLPGDVVAHPSDNQVPDVGGKGGAVLLLGVDEGVHMAIVPQLECV